MHYSLTSLSAVPSPITSVHCKSVMRRILILSIGISDPSRECTVGLVNIVNLSYDKLTMSYQQHWRGKGKRFYLWLQLAKGNCLCLVSDWVIFKGQKFPPHGYASNSKVCLAHFSASTVSWLGWWIFLWLRDVRFLPLKTKSKMTTLLSYILLRGVFVNGGCTVLYPQFEGFLKWKLRPWSKNNFFLCGNVFYQYPPLPLIISQFFRCAFTSVISGTGVGSRYSNTHSMPRSKLTRTTRPVVPIDPPDDSDGAVSAPEISSSDGKFISCRFPPIFLGR